MGFLYKYCPVYSSDNLDKEYSIINLLNNQVKFSTRNNFNDLFDSKVEFRVPNKLELKKAHSMLKGKDKHEFKKNFLGVNGKQNFKNYKQKLNEKLDTYLFFCLADKPDNNLMWSHYANSHKGFCLEWDATEMNAEPVTYQSQIASFELLDVVKMIYGLLNDEVVARKTWDALKVKLDDWSYEGEHRVQLGLGMNPLVKERGENFSIVSYKPEWIKSIIFGCRMEKKVLEYLDHNLPSNIQRKYAKERVSSIEIVSTY